MGGSRIGPELDATAIRLTEDGEEKFSFARSSRFLNMGTGIFHPNPTYLGVDHLSSLLMIVMNSNFVQARGAEL